jgi:PST family polysaccharide transporter
MSTTILSLAMLFQDLGLSRAVMHYQERVDEIANIAFWANTLLSTVMAFVVISSAHIIGAFYKEPRLVDVLRVQSIGLILTSLYLVQETLLRKAFRFKQLFARSLVPVVSSFVIAIPLAALGFGYWALIVASLVSGVIHVLLLWTASSWRPSLSVDWRLTRSTLGFGGMAMVEILQAWLINIGDRIVIGYYLGAIVLGQYVFADSLMTTVFSLTGIGMSVAFPAFCALQRDRLGLAEVYLEVVQSIAVLAIPAGLGLAVLAFPLVNILLGPQWQPLQPLIVLLGIYGITSVGSPNSGLFTAVGRPDIIPKIHTGLILYLIPTYLIGVQFGVVGFTVAKISQVTFLIVQTIVVGRVLNLRRLFLWDLCRKPLFAGLVMTGSVWLVAVALNAGRGPNLGNLLKLALMLLVGATVYGGALYLLDGNLVRKNMRRIVRAFAPGLEGA